MIFYWIAYHFFRLLSFIYFPRTVYGAQNIPRRGAFIIASNHLSNMDPMIVGICCRQQMSYLAKDSLFKNKFFAVFVRWCGAFPIKRGTADTSAIKEALGRLKKGRGLVLFPEGTRRKNPSDAIEAHPGVGLIAVKSGVPVIPVYLEGSDKLLPPGARFLHRHPLTLNFGSPQVYIGDDYAAISRQILDRIYALAPQVKQPQ